MRWWKVKTRAIITVESNWFGYKKNYNCSFTYGSKFIYAKTSSDAKMKYGDLFFTPAEDGYKKDTLRDAKYYFEGMSSNMNFDLPFNYKIVHTHEYIAVQEREINEPIDVVRKLSSANDFRDWLMNGTTDNYSIDELDWMDK